MICTQQCSWWLYKEMKQERTLIFACVTRYSTNLWTGESCFGASQGRPAGFSQQGPSSNATLCPQGWCDVFQWGKHIKRCQIILWHVVTTRLGMLLCHLFTHILVSHINLFPPVATEVDERGSCNNTCVPWNCWLPVIPDSCLKRHWYICCDREAVHCIKFRQRPFNAQHSHLFKWNSRGVKGPVSRQCHDESESTFRTCSYAGHYSSAHKFCLPQREGSLRDHCLLTVWLMR